jgi:hypothetical protein
LIVWVAVDGGTARQGSVIGAIASFGILVIWPLAQWAGGYLSGFRPAMLSHIGTTGLVVTHALVVTLASRLAGLQEQGQNAAILLTGVAAIGWLAISARANPSADPHRVREPGGEGSFPPDPS